EGMGVVPQLGGHEQLLARDAGLGDRTTHALLVLVDAGGVEVAVTGGEGLRGDIGGDVRIHLEHAVAELRDRATVTEGERGNDGVRSGRHGGPLPRERSHQPTWRSRHQRRRDGGWPTGECGGFSPMRPMARGSSVRTMNGYDTVS